MDIDVQGGVLPVVVFFTMLSVGLDLELAQLRQVLRRPRPTVLGTMIHTFTLPVLALALVGSIVALEVPVASSLLIGTLLIAACPSGGFSNVLVLMAQADLALSVVLTTISTALSFLTIPLFLWGFGLLLPESSVSVRVPVAATLWQLLKLIVIPLAIGGYFRHAWPRSALRHKAAVQRVMQIAVYLVVAVTLVQEWEIVRDHLVQSLLWSVGLCGATLALGYGASAMSGLSSPACATIALEGSIRNLAVAFLVASNILKRIDVAVLPTVYFVAVLIVGSVFATVWKRKSRPFIA